MDGIGVGIIGCGNISTIYMQNMARFAGLRLVACASRSPGPAVAQAARFGIEALSTEALLAHADIGIVLNLTVPNAHFAVSHAALTAGKHVFTEKPLAATVEQGRRLVAEAESRGLSIGTAPDTFLGAGAQLARRLLDRGAIGRVLAGSAILLSHGMEHWHPDPEFFYQPGGGPVLDMGPYYLSALVNLLGPVARVQALGQRGFAERLVTAPGPRLGQRIAVETPTTLQALLDFAGGAQIGFAMSWDVWKHGHPDLELYGTEGSMRVPDPNWHGGTVHTTERGGDWIAHGSEALPYGEVNYRGPAWPATRPSTANWRCVGVAELAAHIRHGTPLRTGATLGLHVLEVMEAILQAAATGHAVSIETQPDRPHPLDETAAHALLRPS